MIVVTGATGRLGGLAVERLLERDAEVAVSVRTPDKAARLAARGVEVRRGDYTDPDLLASSFAGARTVLLVSAATFGDEAVRQHATAIEAARRAGVERVVYTSHQCASATTQFAAGHDHWATEQLLADSGLRWTALRDGFHAATLGFWLAMARDGVLSLPEDGPVSWTTHEDLADAAAAVLLDDARADGPTPPLTGPEALDATAVAERASAATGTAYRREVVGDEAFVAGLVGHGTPEPMAEALLTMFLASRAGDFDVVDPYLAELTGHPATPVDATLSAAAGSASAR
jgi:NAD(P)H dehydrogenase (quinone)